MSALTLEERFWAKVDKSGECWIWTAATYSNGYGHFGVSATTGALAHRLSWELLVAPIPEGKMLDHTCHTRACVNPGHLRIATAKQNLENPGILRRDNTSGVRGVNWHARAGKWRARVTHNSVEHHVGLFADKAEAEAAAIAKRNELFTHNDADRSAA